MIKLINFMKIKLIKNLKNSKYLETIFGVFLRKSFMVLGYLPTMQNVQCTLNDPKLKQKISKLGFLVSRRTQAPVLESAIALAHFPCPS